MLIYDQTLVDGEGVDEDSVLDGWFSRGWGHDRPVLRVDMRPLNAWVMNHPVARTIVLPAICEEGPSLSPRASDCLHAWFSARHACLRWGYQEVPVPTEHAPECHQHIPTEDTERLRRAR
jgi:hypothetical protein